MDKYKQRNTSIFYVKKRKFNYRHRNQTQRNYHTKKPFLQGYSIINFCKKLINRFN